MCRAFIPQGRAPGGDLVILRPSAESAHLPGRSSYAASQLAVIGLTTGGRSLGVSVDRDLVTGDRIRRSVEWVGERTNVSSTSVSRSSPAGEPSGA